MIDVHAHTTIHRLWGLHVASATIEDLEKLAEDFGIEKIILMATYFPFKKSGLSNNELIQRIKGKKMFAMFGSLDVMNNLKAGIKELEELCQRKIICGIKLYPGYQEFSLADEKVFPIYKLAERFNLPVAIHSGELHYCCSKEERDGGKFRCGKECKIEKLAHLSQPLSAMSAIQKFPNVNFIMAHLGNPYFGELRQLMNQCLNVCSDISGQFTSGTDEDYAEYREILKQEINLFLKLSNGSKRIMFGTDFPIQSYQHTFEILNSLSLDDKTRNDICSENAKTIIPIY